jgi:NADPH-dependent 2,4-dienoyl-CoA reductase/sulfur reductase-like enzyme
MVSDLLRVFGKVLKYFLPFSIQLLRQEFQAIVHRWTYKQVESPKNVVVIGGSFTGLQLATRLSHTLPTGYRVILIEKNSHFNFSYNFPRYSVLRGHEARAFIPYDATGKDCPPGIFKIIQGMVTNVERDFVQLDTGERIPYSYLAIASGSSQPLPAKVASSNKAEACKELQSVQESIKTANTIAIIGGGAVGVEIATDIKSYYPGKQVTIVHSRQQLLPHFGSRLHEYVSEKIVKMGIHLQLGERPLLPYEKGISQGLITDGTLLFSTGEQHFELIVQPPSSINTSKSHTTNISPDPLYRPACKLIIP